MLYRVLPYVVCTSCCKDVIIVHPTFLRRRGVACNHSESLVIILHHNTLITCYWCSHTDYLYRKEANAHFQELI